MIPSFKIFFIFIFVSFFSSFSFAEKIFWQQLTATQSISKSFSAFGEFQPRWVGSFSKTQILLLRTILFYKINQNLRAGVGYGWMPQYLPIDRNENRFFQQLDWVPTFNQNIIWDSAFRTRVEERLLQFTTGPSIRLRQKAQLNWMIFNPKFGLYIWDELFLNLNSKPKQVGFGLDQNRVSAGIRLKKENLTIEFGLIDQWIYNTMKHTSKNFTGLLLNIGASI